MRALCWFRRDLRLEDNPAWARATGVGDEVAALYVLDPALFDRVSDRRRDLLLAHLAALDRTLGGRLTLLRGDPRAVVPRFVADHDIAHVTWNADVSAYAQDRDRVVTDALAVPVEPLWGTLVQPPGTVLTAKGGLSRVFTPFHRAWQRVPHEVWPTAGPATLVAIAGDPLPDPAREPAMTPGEDGAHERLDQWLDRVDAYVHDRDLPGRPGTSHLSADLRFGTISPRLVLDRVGDHTDGRAAFCRQLAWRDWYAHTTLARPDITERAMRPEYDAIEWRHDPVGVEAWQTGRTGFPIVDAGMRELLATGFMHNRVRMLVASFLVKDLLVDWRIGERFFRHHLLDGDVAQNAGNWQWVAGTGPDAAPYFRVFNPTTQSERFDPDGTYIRRWLPELEGLDRRSIHQPSRLGPLELAAAGVTLGQDYPEPIVDHGFARERTLAAYKAAKSAS
ncbi:MAG: DNA photolyase family protein [Acidimicrobiia bacterium]|nr:DNA photolyase family protein [Acidimicrobiia bacterium]MDH5236840.1 DNA photolyase family protein [Acidimicrobiia bacterium]